MGRPQGSCSGISRRGGKRNPNYRNRKRASCNTAKFAVSQESTSTSSKRVTYVFFCLSLSCVTYEYIHILICIYSYVTNITYKYILICNQHMSIYLIHISIGALLVYNAFPVQTTSANPIPCYRRIGRRIKTRVGTQARVGTRRGTQACSCATQACSVPIRVPTREHKTAICSYSRSSSTSLQCPKPAARRRPGRLPLRTFR